MENTKNADCGNSTFIHDKAIVEPGAKVGERTRVWAFAHVLSAALIGEDCNICDHVFIENDVRIGNRVTVKSGVQLWDGVTLEDDVFVGPNVTFTNDIFPRSKAPFNLARTVVRKGASVGANATILGGLVIGANSMVGAGSVVTKDVPPNAIVVGNPARIKGYAGSSVKPTLDIPVAERDPSILKVPGVKLHRLPIITDMRGSLSFGEYDKHLPFIPKRYFVIYDIPTKEVRGEHAHRTLHEFLICITGSCSIMVDDGLNRDEVVLSSPSIGAHIPPMTWLVHYKYSRDAVLLVLASDVYEADDYIRDYDQFIEAINLR
jgi:UDP-2-acetamido-3-amino-2,3-dideoxy-glucuronate N-acetyltransferase